MTDRNEFQPDWVTPPGSTIADILEERGWTQAEFATRTGFTRKHVNDLIRGRATITPETASRLSNTLGADQRFWLTREAQYRAAVEQARHLEKHGAETAWLRALPLQWMIKHGWIRRLRHRGAQVEECLRYFGVASVDRWHETYAQPLAAFRASAHATMSVGAVTAWLREAERRATALDVADYDAERFLAALPDLRVLTSDARPADFIPRLQQRCAATGVAVVFVPAPPGCPVHGSTRWMTPTRALLALSGRYKTDDQFWFSFFHEACHVLRHRKKQQFIEGVDGLDESLEAEADTFAADLLIPPGDARELGSLRSEDDVVAMARALGVSPGVVVGRMQHDKLIPFSRFNRLKTRYEWEDPISPTTAAPSRRETVG